MITKQCMACDGYFDGALDGEYVCEACRAAGAAPKRKLASLDTDVPSGGESPLAKRQAA